MLPIVVVTRGIVERCHTLRLLDEAGLAYSVVVHDDEAADRLHSADVRGWIAVSGTTTLVEKRNWILEHHIPRGQWFIGMDDNVRNFTMVAQPFYDRGSNPTQGNPPHSRNKTWRQIYNCQISPLRWLTEMSMEAASCEDVGIPLFGVATMENPFFRGGKYSGYRFVKSKVFAMRNEPDLYWKHEMCHDSFLSALCVARYGRVRVNSYMHYKAKMYEVGGLGGRKQRESRGLLEQLAEIMREFPGLVAMGRGANTALRFVHTREKSVEAWRARYREMNP